MRVLIVDDDAVALTLLESVLVEAGYEVVTADNGNTAFEIIQAGSCRLMVADWEMPGMNGTELCQAIRAAESLDYIYVILLTAHGTASERVTGLTAGADDFVTKPYDPPELLARVRAGERILASALAERNRSLQSELIARRQIETALRRSEERYRFLADAMPQIVWIAGPDGRREYFNRQWYEYSGLTETQTLGTAWMSVLHPDDVEHCRERWSSSVQTGRPYEIEYQMKRASDGAYRWHLARAFPMRDEEGRIIQWIGTCTDIHDQKLAEEALREHRIELEKANRDLHEKNQRLSELYRTAQGFVDDVSHEFRTPLTVIKEFSSIMRDGLSGSINAEQREYLDIVINRVDDLGTMVDDLLDSSKLEAGMLGVCRRAHTVEDVVEAVRTTLERKAAAQKVSLHIDIEHDLPAIYCDLEKIGRALVNLTVNAIKFSKEGGAVRVWAQRPDHECEVVIGVSDQGPGIAHENVQSIFDRFRQVGSCKQTQIKGFGLGLNIAKELVHLNLGEMHVESTIGKGSTFSFSLPTADPPALLARWMRHVERGGTRLQPCSTRVEAAVSLLAVTCQDTARAPLEDVEDFLQHNVRYNDLLLPAGRGKWLWALAADRKELKQMMDRVEEAVVDENRNRPSGALPSIRFLAKGTWSACDGGPAIMDCVERELSSRQMYAAGAGV